MRDVEQVMRFYLIGKRVAYRSVKSLMDSPNWNPLLVKVVKDLETHLDYGIDRCKKIREEISEGKFKFIWKPQDIMSISEEELPRGTFFDTLELIEIVGEIEDWLKRKKEGI